MASSSSLSLSIPSSSFSGNWDVFPSFHGPDVRATFLSHVLREFKDKGINSFIDNQIERGESIGPELIRAIKGSKILIVLLSKRYASSSWCLDELVEIMNKKPGQTVMTIFYNLDPTDVKKQTGYFGKVFKKTCIGKAEEKIGTWKKALAGVATIAGYHLKKGVDEAAMIEEIVVDISNKLNTATPSRDFGCFIGMEAHMEKMESLLRLDLNEQLMIGIWGPPGIGKSTIARFIYNRFSNSFLLRLLMVDIKENYPLTCLNEVSVQLKLQRKMLSKLLNHKIKAITDLGVARARLNDKKVFLVLDEVDRLAQLVALAEKKEWFGLGSRIIIISENRRVLNAQGVDHIYKVGFPTTDEAFQMFCMYAFGQKYPKDGFEELAREVTYHAGTLPLGVKVMGSHFRRMSKEEWTKELPMVRSRLDREIESILKFSYDALDDEDKDLFLHIACVFNSYEFEKVVEYLEKRFPNVRQQLNVLYEKSLIHTEIGLVLMHDLLVQLGRNIVRKQSIESGQRQFLTNVKDIHHVLNNNAADIRRVIGINICFEDKSNINERAFEGTPNLQFLIVKGRLPHGLSYLPPKLRLLWWDEFPMTCLPFPVKLESLLELSMSNSKLEKLWEGNKSIRNLLRMDLSYSKKFKELPNMSTATSLKELLLAGCLSLVKLPYSIGNATNLQKLDLSECSSLVKLPSSIGNATNLQELDLSKCSSLVKLPSSIGKATNLKKINLEGCSSLVELPFSIGNATNLQELDLSKCSSLVKLPSSIGKATNLKKINLEGCSSLVELPFSIGNATNLQELDLTQCSSLLKLPSSIGNATNLQKIYLKGCSSLVELPFSIGNTILNCHGFLHVDFRGFSSLLKIPSFIENAINLYTLDFSGCSSIVEVVSASIGNLHKLVVLIFEGCSKLEFLPVNVNLKSLDKLDLSGCSSLKSFPEISTNISYLDLSGTAIEEVPSSIKTWYRLCELILEGCKNLLSLLHLPESLFRLKAVNCESLERLDWSSSNSNICFNFGNCFKLNKDARDLIIQRSIFMNTHVLPGKEIPIYFTHRANGGCLVLKLNERPFPSILEFKACILLVSKNNTEDSDDENDVEDGDEEENDIEDIDVGNDVEDGNEENAVEDDDEENNIEDSDEENDIEDSDDENDVEDSDEENDFEDSDEESDFEDSYEENDFEDSEDDEVLAVYVVIRDKQSGIPIWHNLRSCQYLHHPLTEHLYIFEFEAVVSSHIQLEFAIYGGKWVIKECGVHYEDCEAESAETKKRKMDQNGDTSVIIDNVSKYTSNSEAGCSKPRAIVPRKLIHMTLYEENFFNTTHEDGITNMLRTRNVSISGDCEAEEEVNGKNSVDTKKKKKTKSFYGLENNFRRNAQWRRSLRKLELLAQSKTM